MTPQSSVDPAVDSSTVSGSKPQLESREEGDSQTKPDPSAVGADQGVMPHTTLSATAVAGEIADGVKTVIDGVSKWTGQKVDQLSEDDERGVGPYASPALCIPSDLDPLASGVLPAMEADKSKGSQSKHDSKDDEGQKNAGRGVEK